MTKEEFIQGWTLLIAQPWGARYARADSEIDRLTAKTQMDLYYREFAGADADDWLKACRQHAKGTKWPSIDELRISVRARPTTRSTPAIQAMTLAEFGKPLFLAIQWATAVQWLDQAIARAILSMASPQTISALRARRARALEEARQWARHESISDADAAELARRYPWIL